MYKRFDTGDPDEFVAVCPDCDGEGSLDVFNVLSETSEWVQCPDCGGKGTISAEADDF
jgi:DnaJ-class molecular chaperone